MKEIRNITVRDSYDIKDREFGFSLQQKFIYIERVEANHIQHLKSIKVC